MSKVNTEHIVRLVLEVDLYKRPTSIPIITVLMLWLLLVILLTITNDKDDEHVEKCPSLEMLVLIFAFEFCFLI